jgi:ribosome-binding protein aMBF1 (putative translation factor)
MLVKPIIDARRARGWSQRDLARGRHSAACARSFGGGRYRSARKHPAQARPRAGA